MLIVTFKVHTCSDGLTWESVNYKVHTFVRGVPSDKTVNYKVHSTVSVRYVNVKFEVHTFPDRVTRQRKCEL